MAKSPTSNQSAAGGPTIAPARGDIESRRRRGGAAPGQTSYSSSIVVNLVIVLLICGLAAAGWFINQQHVELISTQDALTSSNKRIRALEERLSMTDEALNQTEGETQNQLSFWESEIRKLWDVSNKRNRGWIIDNQKAVATLQSTSKKQAQVARELQAMVAVHQEALGDQQALLAKLAALETRTMESADALNTAVMRLNALKADLERRVKDNEEAVAAVDAFRIQTNRTLRELQAVPQ